MATIAYHKELTEIISSLSETGVTKTNSFDEFLIYLNNLFGINGLDLKEYHVNIHLSMIVFGRALTFSCPKSQKQEKEISESFRVSIISYLKNLLYTWEKAEADLKN